ncbi:MAG: alcohol dehydrogenase catalytic domain-containing protein [Pirellulales bacterium]
MTAFPEVCRAAVFSGVPGSIAVAELPVTPPRGGELLVRVVGCTLCGSDLHSFHGRRGVPTPTVLGHEIVGRIVEFGPDSPRVDLGGAPLNVGDRIVWAVVADCGECFYCRRGLPQKCERSVKYGHEAFRPGRELLGGLADYCLLVAGRGSYGCPTSCRWPRLAPSGALRPPSWRPRGRRGCCTRRFRRSFASSCKGQACWG